MQSKLRSDRQSEIRCGLSPVGDVWDKENKGDKEEKAQKKSFPFQPTTYDHTQ
ncbi:hypothetical protein LAY57_17190 [Argonema antarcticum A004/B2]|nr:hypothetical protein [Argonema antarcticum A004/B2]